MRQDVAAQYFVVLRRMVVAFEEATRREYRGMMTWLECGCFAIFPQCQQPGENNQSSNPSEDMDLAVWKAP